MALMMIMMIMMVMRVMIMMMNIAAMQIKICDHNLIRRVKVDLVFVLFFCPFPKAPCQFDVPGLACGEKIYLIYIYMSILFFAESQRRKRIHTKDYCLISQRHSQFGKI